MTDRDEEENFLRLSSALGDLRRLSAPLLKDKVEEGDDTCYSCIGEDLSQNS